MMNSLSLFFFHSARGSPARILDWLAPWNLFARSLRLPVTAEVLVATYMTTITCHCRGPCGYVYDDDYLSLQRSLWLRIWWGNPEHNPRLWVLQLVPGLEVPWKTGWSCWQATQPNTDRFTCDITGPAGFWNRSKQNCGSEDFFKHAGISQQTLEQRSSFWNWPMIKQDFICIVPLQNTPSWQLQIQYSLYNVCVLEIISFQRII